jgi:hypothetical protein
MNPNPESTQRNYTEAELAGLFATYFGDKLTQSQLDSLVVTVAEAHANRRARAAEVPEWLGRANSARRLAGGRRTTVQGSVAHFFGGCAPARPPYPSAPG